MTQKQKHVQNLLGIALFSILGLMVVWQVSRADLPVKLALNLQGLRLLRSSDKGEIEATLTSLVGRDCHAAWLLGAVSAELEHAVLREAAWQEAIRCSK